MLTYFWNKRNKNKTLFVQLFWRQIPHRQVPNNTTNGQSMTTSAANSAISTSRTS